MKKTLGILGGMGPLASAEFLKTIYEFNSAKIEQEMPVCFLYSDPTIPDRTDAIVNELNSALVHHFVEALGRLNLLGVTKIVIPCITIHHFLPKVPLPLRGKIISLVDLILQEVVDSEEPCLLLCTNGALQAGIFQYHHLWNLAEKHVIFPYEEQNTIHRLIYQIKREGINETVILFLDNLLKKYQVSSFIAGCTEIHLLTKYLIQQNNQSYFVVDPLLTIAKDLKQFLESRSEYRVLNSIN
jgi:aspartate racemase